MSQQDAAKEQANTRKNVRVVSIFTAAAIGIVGVLVILYAWQLPPFTRHAQFTDNAYVRGQTTFISPQVNGYITEVHVQDFAQVKKGELLLQIDDRIYRQRVHQAEAQLAMKIAALNNNLQQRKSAEAVIAKNEAALKNARAQSLKTQADLKRVKELTADGSLSIRERDSALASAAQGAPISTRRKQRLRCRVRIYKRSSSIAVRWKRTLRMRKPRWSWRRSICKTPGLSRRVTVSSGRLRCVWGRTSPPGRTLPRWSRRSTG